MDDNSDDKAIIRRKQSLAAFGMPFIPYIGMNRYIARYHPVLHSHDGCLEILFFTNGICKYRVGNAQLVLKPNDVLVIQPNAEHSIAEYPKGLCAYSIHIRLNVRQMPGLTVGETQWLRQQFKKLPPAFNSGRQNIRERFSRVLALTDAATPTAENQISLRVAALDLLLAILSAAKSPRQPTVNHRIQTLIRQMQRHPEERYPLARLARDCGLSTNALITLFRLQTGNTPHAYLLSQRIERAKELLPGRTNAAVAHAVGFPSPQYFATQFKRLVGLSPREYAARDK